MRRLCSLDSVVAAIILISLSGSSARAADWSTTPGPHWEFERWDGTFCGDGICQPDYESVDTCPQDCVMPYCGDGKCDTELGETETNCPFDCVPEEGQSVVPTHPPAFPQPPVCYKITDCATALGIYASQHHGIDDPYYSDPVRCEFSYCMETFIFCRSDALSATGMLGQGTPVCESDLREPRTSIGKPPQHALASICASRDDGTSSPELQNCLDNYFACIWSAKKKR